MKILTPAERRAMRAKAHHLHPVATVGRQGLTPAVLHEIDVALLAHELIKIRVFDDDRGQRESLLARICGELDAAPVQHIGKLFVIWRPAPEPEPAPARPATRKGNGAAKRTARAAAAKPNPNAGTGSASRRRRAPEPESGGDAVRRRRRASRDQASAGAPAPPRRRRRTP